MAKSSAIIKFSRTKHFSMKYLRSIIDINIDMHTYLDFHSIGQYFLSKVLYVAIQ